MLLSHQWQELFYQNASRNIQHETYEGRVLSATGRASVLFAVALVIGAFELKLNPPLTICSSSTYIVVTELSTSFSNAFNSLLLNLNGIAG